MKQALSIEIKSRIFIVKYFCIFFQKKELHCGKKLPSVSASMRRKNVDFNLVHNGLQSQEIGCLDLKGILMGFYLPKQKSMCRYTWLKCTVL